MIILASRNLKILYRSLDGLFVSHSCLHWSSFLFNYYIIRILAQLRSQRGRQAFSIGHGQIRPVARMKGTMRR